MFGRERGSVWRLVIQHGLQPAMVDGGLPVAGVPRFDGGDGFLRIVSGINETKIPDSLATFVRSIGQGLDEGIRLGVNVEPIDPDGNGCKNALLVSSTRSSGDNGATIYGMQFSWDQSDITNAIDIVEDINSNPDIAVTIYAPNSRLVVVSLGDADGDSFPDVLVASPRSGLIETRSPEGEIRQEDAGELFVFQFGANLQVKSILRIGQVSAGQVGPFQQLSGSWPNGLLPPRQWAMGSSLSASDIDGDGTIEVAMGMLAWSSPMDAGAVDHDSSSEVSVRSGGVILFSLSPIRTANGAHGMPAAAGSILEAKASANSSFRTDSSLVVPGSIRFLSPPPDRLMKKST